MPSLKNFCLENPRLKLDKNREKCDNAPRWQLLKENCLEMWMNFLDKIKNK